MALSDINDFDIFRTPVLPATMALGKGSGYPRILVVDDDETIRETLRLALKGLFEVILCASGEEGLKALTPEVAAVILDIKMKGKDGFVTYVEMKRKCFHVPIIFHSAYQDIKDPYEILNSFRPFGYVFKGSGMGQLTDALHNAVEYSEMRSENENLVHELQSLNLSLESQVEERTIELNERATELEQANSELIHAKETAEETTRAKSDFLANMSHEIRTPMNGIIGMTELALGTTLTSSQREFLGMVKTSADSLLAIINDILDFSKIEAGKFDLDPIDFNLRDSLADTVKTLALRAHQKGLELAFRCAGDVPDEVVGDPGRLRQIVVNLIGNAIKFTDHGEVLVRVALESQTEDSVFLHFSIDDTGIGIPVAKQRLIFEAFSQADASTTRQYGGTGLGLTICSRLVEMMKGSIWVESKAEKGSSFQFTAQFRLQADSKIVTQSRSQPDLADLPVLVVDDNRTNRLILEEVLTSWQMAPTLVESGAAALLAMEHACEEAVPFALVLLDCQMPEMDGFSLAEEIRRRPHLNGAIIMMLTSGGQGSDAARCRDLGIADHLLKPIKQSELLDSIVRVLNIEPPRLTERPQESATVISSASALRILLAEDNEINQKLAIHHLQKRGHCVTPVRNGHEALAATALANFDLILMDVQMPGMGGFEATAEIRNQEQDTGTHIPIVAMTAHAMKGDDERCLAAGMDGYVSKPIQAERLFGEIERVTSISFQAHCQTKSPSLGQPFLVPSFDTAAALNQVGNDRELFREIIGLFLADNSRQMSAIKSAVESRDVETLSFAAHSLKGVVGNFRANAASNAAQRIESMADRNDLTGIDGALADLQGEIEALSRDLTAFHQSVERL